MKRCRGCLLLSCLLLTLLARPLQADAKTDFFEAKIRPLLSSKCYSCHTRKASGGLRLDSREAILKGGTSGPAVVPGDSEKSLLLRAVRRVGGLKMPPKEKLADREVRALVRWINDGAVWGEKVEVTITPKDRAHWAFRPVGRPPVPKVDDADWGRHPIDAFLFAKMKAKGVRPVGLADRRTLIRRLSYDLIGLPPTAEEVEAFVTDDEPKAYKRLVERLLASRHYGERWARHWLDVVRYADTAGDASDFPVPEAYKYRNYVIEAFEEDLPYDRFIREQLAGDLLTWSDDDERWRQTIATGYLAISRRIGVSPQNLRHITLEDTIDNLGKTFLGLTVGCARCHDHKFDPIPTADYYALYGIFDSTVYPHAGAEHKPYREDFVYRVGRKKADASLAPYRQKLAPWDKKERDKFAEYRRSQSVKPTDPSRTREVIWNEVLAVRAERAGVAETFPDLEIAYAVREGMSHDVNVHKAGNPRDKGPFVRRGFLSILGGQKLPDDHPTSGRLELANWIASSDNPLTARVIVNRIWHHHFGRGIVPTTSNFGLRGSPSSHPELLDWLARYFVEHGWSIKTMHRLIVTSRAYRLANTSLEANRAIDPDNVLLWRANRRRLDAEQLRDSILMFGGTLDTSRGGRHPFPHRLTYFYRQHEPFQTPMPTNRRSIYAMQQRIQKNPYLDLFDGPDGNLPLAQRKTTTTTLQALYLMNSKFIHEHSARIAKRMFATEGSLRGRATWAYRTIFGRPPTPEEVRRTRQYVTKADGLLGQSGVNDSERERRVWASYVRSMIGSNAFLYVD